MHGERGRVGLEPRGADAEHRKSRGLCGMGQHGLECYET